jgi:cholesterol oxidase
MKAAYEYVIIGSGFGGAIAACRIAEAQRAAGRPASVCVLERGKRYGLGEFPRDFSHSRSWLWCEGGHDGWTGLFDYRSFPNIGVITGSGVGGTSLVYLDVQLEAFASTFEVRDPVNGHRRWPETVNWVEEMPEYYDRLTQMLRPTAIPEPPMKAFALEAAARGLGEADRFRLLPLAIYWGREGSERGVLNTDPYVRGGPPQYGCQYCGECYIGCNIHSKNTLDLNYLWLAERAGAEVYSLHNVVRIEPNAPGDRLHPNGYTVEYEDLRWSVLRGRVSARRLIVAAGALGSTELLLRAKHGYRRNRAAVAPTLPHLSDRLGTCFSGNGDFGAMATRTSRDTAPMVGPTITALLDYSGELDGHGFLVEDGGLPDVLRAHLRRLPGGLGYWRRVVRAAKELVGRGAERKLVEGFFDWLDFETVRDALPLLVMGHDAADGVMTIDAEGELTIDWQHAKSWPYLRILEAAARRIAEAPPPGLDGNTLFPFPWSLKKQLITFHPLGGCPMGSDAREGVVNHAGEVFNHANLYVLDGSIVPSAIGPNPSKTIGALAERGVKHIIASDPTLGPASDTAGRPH